MLIIQSNFSLYKMIYFSYLIKNGKSFFQILNWALDQNPLQPAFIFDACVLFQCTFSFHSSFQWCVNFQLQQWPFGLVTLDTYEVSSLLYDCVKSYIF